MTLTPQPSPPGDRRSLAGRLLRAATVIASVGALVGATVGGITILHQRAAAEAARAPADPVAVATVPLVVVDHHVRESRYVGRIEPARRTDLAFERAGRVTTIAVDEGAQVREGDVVARLDTVQLEASRRQLEARARELDAQRRLAEATRGRQTELGKRGWSPDQRIDDAEAVVAQVSAAIDQVRAQIAAVDIDIEKSRLVAPFAGRISSRAIDEGAVVSGGTPIVTLLETGRRQARVGLPPDVAGRLDPAATYTLTAGNETLPARLVAVRPDLDTGTRTTAALFDIGPHVAAPALGDIVMLSLVSRVEAVGAWVPVTALTEGRKGLWTVLVVTDGDGGPRVRAEVAEVLHAEADRVFVRGTFRAGDRIVSGGTERVVAGQRVALISE